MMRTPSGLYYEDQGSGDTTLVLLHYFGSSGNAWAPLQERLGAGIRSITPHLRGFGQSAAAPGPFRLADSVRDLNELLQPLRLQRYTLIGHSMGGKIALAFAASAPAGLDSLVLLAPSPPTPEPMTEDEREAMRATFGDAGALREHLTSICGPSLPPEAILQQEVASHLQASEAAWNAWLDGGSKENIADAMPAVSVPALLISGEKDSGIQPAMVDKEVAGRLRRVQHEVLPRTGHLIHLEQPDRVATLVRRWL